MFVMLLSLIIYLLYKYESNSYKLTILLIIITFISTDLIHNHCFKEVFQRLRPCWDPEISEKCRVLVEKGGGIWFVSGHSKFLWNYEYYFFVFQILKLLLNLFFLFGDY